ncbi:FAD-dependent oxidoreductase [Sphingorhabdus sp.]|jgi:D-amino-acid dehydrogenase|uniref:FAD-dependent oxidoreductase n=1 Tax=Sphingorhabdus sp. TaxID=1902408 RepID=UPI003BAF06B0|nr:FAD-dependent oxidoreductase [Sphingomonadales bacterium]
MVREKTSGANMPPRRALVVGAGVVGVATAYALARRGAEVTILDKGDAPGSGASFANGAQLSYIYTEALANSTLLKRLPALALGLDSGFRLRPVYDPCQIRWLLQFLRNCTQRRFLANTLAGMELGLESRLAMQALLSRHSVDFGHKAAGKILIYQDREAFRSACELVEIRQRHGAEQEILSPDEAVRTEYALTEQRQKFVGAIYSPQEELGDPNRFCCALLALLQQDYGVQVKLETMVESWKIENESVIVETKAGEQIVSSQIVICAGIEAGSLLKKHRLGSALMPMKGYSITAPRGQAAPTMSITDVARKVVFCPLDGKVRIAGLAELGVRNALIDPRRVEKLKSIAADALPEAADYKASNGGWAGIRPMTANSLPLIRKVAPRVTINVGHGMLGWTYAMGSAERVARLMGGLE